MDIPKWCFASLASYMCIHSPLILETARPSDVKRRQNGPGCVNTSQLLMSRTTHDYIAISHARLRFCIPTN